jgi:WS/DGAT/MGAT family acyltransferase
MSHTHYDRLSAQDNTFLLFETPNSHMHVSSTLVFEAGPLRTDDGGIDIDRIKRATAGYLHLIPRYRQKLAFIPLENHAVWVDDEHFDLDYHVRHTSLPRPGSAEQLKQISSRIMAQPLDRARPLWETWIVEGLEGGRFAMITKIHHCMIDGSSGVDIAQIMMSTTPDRTLTEAPAFHPRPAPSSQSLLTDALWRRISLPLQAAQGLRHFARESEDLVEDVKARAKILWDMVGMGMRASKTPLNGPLGPHRRFDWLEMSLEDMKAVRRALDCSINDVVLTVVTSAVRAFLLRRGVDPKGIDFKVAAPVSVRREEERGQLGNRVSSWILALPIDTDQPAEQLRRIHETTKELKESNQALGVEMMMAVAEWAPANLLSLGAQSVSGPINTIVTNVPGPQFPLYVQGAKLEAMYPQVPLMEGLGLGLALVSYNGQVCWGFNANPDVVPDLAAFTQDVRDAFAQVAEAAGVTLGPRQKAVEAAPKPQAKKVRAEADKPRPSDDVPPGTPIAH